MTQEELLFKEAREAIDKGEIPLAKDLLARLLKINQSNPDYWLWMSGVVETAKERGYCLKEVLKLDPGNVLAIKGLRLIGEDIPDPNPGPAMNQLRNKWKTSLEIEPPKVESAGKIRARIFAFSLMGVLVVGLAIFGVYLALRPKQTDRTAQVVKFSLTPPPTSTIGITPSPTFKGPAPLWTLLKATYTPTPLYVATPHNRSEAFRAAMDAYTASDWTKALQYFGLALAEEPGSPDIQYHIGEIYRFQGANKNALEAYDKAIALDVNFAPAYLGKGRTLLQTNPPKLEDANSNFEKSLELDPQLTEAYVEIANVYLAKNDPQTALFWLGRMDESSPDNPVIEMVRAQAYVQLGEYGKALDAIEKANELDLTSLPVYKMWGSVLQEIGDYEGSLKPLETFLTYEPVNKEVQFLLARAYAYTGKTEEALITVNQVLKEDPNSLAALITRGDIYLMQQEIELAAKDFSNALLFTPQSFEANIGKARTLLAQTYSGSAYEYIQTALKNAVTDRENAIALYWRAVALLGLRENNAAIRDFEAVLAFPEGTLPLELKDSMMEEYLKIVTPTPSYTPSATLTPTPKLETTPTRTPTK